VPLRSKPGQGYVSVVVQGEDELDEAAGRATSRRVSAYYTSAYYAAGAAEGGGGRWCLAVADTRAGIAEGARALLAERGVHPHQEWSQERLEAVLRGEGRRLGTHTQVDRLTGEIRKVRVAKTDTWVYDVPKSVSLLACYGLDDDGWLTGVVEDAARSGMEYLAQQTAYCRRRGADGLVERQHGSAIHFSLVLERTARPAEGEAEALTGVPAPHYHAHVLIHGAIDREGRYGAYDAHDALMSGHRQVASAYADLVLRQRLADRGIAMRRVDPPAAELEERVCPPRWEVASIPEAAIAVASERHRAIRALMAEDPGRRAGPTRDAAAEQLTKAPKAAVDDWPALLRFWRRRIEDAGASAPGAGGGGNGRGPGGAGGGGTGPGVPPADGQVEWPDVEELAALSARLLERFAATRSTFRFLDLRAEILQQIGGTWRRELIGRLCDAIPARWAQDGDLLPRVDGRYALAEVVRQERRILRHWRAMTADLGDDLSALAEPAVAAFAALAGHPLDEGQDLLVQEALRRRAVLAVGVAGAGKTAAAAALRLAVERLGRRVHAVAMANLRARETRVAAQAHRDESVQSVRHALRSELLEGRYARGDFLLVDEASQLSDGALLDLISVAERRGLHLVLLGDPAQQGAIGRGAMVAEIARRGGEAVVELRVAYRFHDPDQATALARMHDGDAWPWLRYAHERGWLRPFAREPEAAAELLRLWREDSGRLLVTLGDNLRRDELNALVVGELVARGEVDPERTVAVRADVRTPRMVELHQGQELRLNRQLRQPDREGTVQRVAANGEVARLVHIERPWVEGAPARLTLRFGEGTPEERLVVASADQLVATGAYAVQCYKAQGSTAERVVVDWEDGRARQQVYPALSRQRDEVIVVGVSRDEDERLRGAAALAERVAEAVERQTVTGAAIARPRAEEWPAAVHVAARGAGMSLDLPPGVAEPGAPEAVPAEQQAGLPGVVPVSALGVVDRRAAAQVDPARVAAAARGEITLDVLTLGEFNELFQQKAFEAALHRLGEREAVELANRERVVEEPVAAAPPPLPRGIVREPEVLRPEVERPPIERDVPVAQREWQPAPSQAAALERAREAWPAVIEVKAAVFEQAVAQLPANLSALEREARLLSYRDRFEADCADAWRVHASQHLITGAAPPELDRDVLARHGVDELVLGAEAEPEPVLREHREVAEREPAAEQPDLLERAGREVEVAPEQVAEAGREGHLDRGEPHAGILGDRDGAVRRSDAPIQPDPSTRTGTEPAERQAERGEEAPAPPGPPRFRRRPAREAATEREAPATELDDERSAARGAEREREAEVAADHTGDLDHERVDDAQVAEPAPEPAADPTPVIEEATPDPARELERALEEDLERERQAQERYLRQERDHPWLPDPGEMDRDMGMEIGGMEMGM
jgi:hypothetical protein